MSRAASHAPRLVLAAACLLAAARAHGAPFTGFIAEPGCAQLDAMAATNGELIVLARQSPPRSFTFLFDLRTKGGAAIDGTWLTPQGYESYGDWGHWAYAGFIRVALPPLAPGAPFRLVLDTSESTIVDCGVVAPLPVGNSLPVGVDAGIGLVLPGSPAAYPVDFGSSVESFPRRNADGSATIAFGPLAEVNATELASGACTVAGARLSSGGRGEIAGYNFYRIPAGPGVTGSPAEFTAALTDGDLATGFQAFIDLGTFSFGTPADVTVDPSVNDTDPSDGASLHNPDGRMYSGDEVILWTDAIASPGRPHPERAPDRDVRYVYSVQPVSTGSIAEVAASFGPLYEFEGEHARDLDGNGSPDSVSLDSTDPADRSVEFISPQADPSEGGLAGLGLTWRSGLLLSSAIWSPEDVLRRSTEVTALTPLAPPLSSILPLGPEDAILTPVMSGDVDPDPAILESSAHPLVFYDVPGRFVRLDIAGGPGVRRVRVTF